MAPWAILLASLPACALALRSRVPPGEWTLNPLRKALQSQVNEVVQTINQTEVKLADEERKKATLEKFAKTIKDGRADVQQMLEEVATAMKNNVAPSEVDAIRQKIEAQDYQVKIHEYALDFLKKTGVDVLFTLHHPKSDRFLLKWAVLKVEDGAAFVPNITEDCEFNGSPLGECYLPKENGQSTPSVFFTSSVPMGDKARVRLLGDGNFLGKAYHMQADCAMCGEKCAITLPLGGSLALDMPDCPIGGMFFMNMTTLDLSAFPQTMHGNFQFGVEIVRPDSTDAVVRFVMDVVV
mmetsp:Transcript_6200/g.14119  ORF Transcript_6200/g.14119 Transcript_6200/m.14119 type:complete len:295 (-) Transcript_6200:112-996(-)